MNDTEKSSKACCSGSCRLKFQSMVKAFNGLLIDFACLRRSLGLHFNLHLILFSLPKQSLISSLSFPWLISHQRSRPDPVTLLIGGKRKETGWFNLARHQTEI